jgi:hypothetical protein
MPPSSVLIRSPLGDNSTLECLDICNLGHGFSYDDCFTALESLQTNTTLKTLRLHPKFDSISEEGKMKHFISLVKKTFWLEIIDEG